MLFSKTKFLARFKLTPNKIQLIAYTKYVMSCFRLQEENSEF